MNVQAVITGPGEARFEFPSSADRVKTERAARREEPAPEASEEKKSEQIQPEELLQNIKALTDNGLYSVHFELYKDTDELVINLIDKKSGDLIRQIPPAEILGMHKVLADLRGNIIETTS
ncbi:MAG: hypothetical protein BWK76_27305 [Desulfobulbaceae bacterium A2]|nr:MAG: hypothetical protein BWK76_27305 [Desulfobulbaceae bacterium A2]